MDVSVGLSFENRIEKQWLQVLESGRSTPWEIPFF
jgi:hypothetical protein